MNCIVCASPRSEFYAKKNGHDVLLCVECRTLRVHPLPSLRETGDVYSKDYFTGATQGFGFVDYEEDKKGMRSVFENHLKHFEDLLKNNTKSLLDVGAATGYFMDVARSRGWEVAGVDISDYAAARGRERGLDLRTGTIESAATAWKLGSFDALTMWDLIEHVPTPDVVLEKAHELLKPGGLIAINTPNAGSLYARLLGKRWHLLVPPEHLWYFNQASVKKLLEDKGFTVLEIGCKGKKFSVEYVLYTLYRWQKLSLWKRLQRAVEGTWLDRLALPINLRDNMFVLARKR